jgi:ketosteroid isomerase-like protein
VLRPLISALLLASGSDADAVRQARLAQNEAIVAGDVERIATFWTEDVTVRRGFGASLSGKEAYRALFDGSSTVIFAREPEVIEISPDWPLAFESGTWTASVGDGSPLVTGRYAAQWVKREASWLIRSEVFVALKCSSDPSAWTVLP